MLSIRRAVFQSACRVIVRAAGPPTILMRDALSAAVAWECPVSTVGGGFMAPLDEPVPAE